MSANPFWTDARLATQRPAARALTLPSPAVEAGAEAVGARAVARGRDLSVPSWVFFCTIMLATFAVCVTVTMRADAAMRGAAQRYEQMSTNVGQIRDTNEVLKREVERLRSDPRAIETAARARLNMLHPNEVVVPLK
ncbi:MAG TPA: septum formation initiator family protein [Pyrinomonadaceae bacterium]|jgi:cell division protein FtsB|nr:septum formation initiator family protein [Pyrinomonadaceae bacterium]